MPADLLGSRKRPADTAAIADWLLSEAHAASGAVLALDTLAWGGLIPSRQSGNDAGVALTRLEALRRLKREHPQLTLLAYSSIQRVNRDDDDGEEPEYFKTYGQRIFRRSVLQHRATAGALDPGEREELKRLLSEVPTWVWDDVLAIRERTAAVNLAALELVEDGVLDALVLNQDDTTTWGLNVQDRARLEVEVRRRRLGERVFVYPGADEVAQVLLARISILRERRRVRVGTFYASRGGANVQTSYEDRPLGDMVSVHLRAAGAVQVPGALSPDLWLGVNSPSRGQGQGGGSFSLENDGNGLLDTEERAWLARLEEPVHGLDRSVAGFVATLQVLLEADQRVSLADVAHVNGADDELMSSLSAAGSLPLLAGYGGWNTAGNALGSAVALGVAASLPGAAADKRGVHAVALAARYLDDWLYQARVRAALLLQVELKPLGLGGFVPGNDLVMVEEQARVLLNDELAAREMPFTVERLTLPWGRVFEIGYDLKRREGNGSWPA